MTSAAENRKNGAKKLVLGLTVGIVTGLTYGVVLPIGIISSFVGAACVAAGATMQGMSPSKDGKSYSLGSAIRFAGACALAFGFGAIAGPTAGPIYSAEGVYNASTGKDLNIFGKTMGFVFGLVAGPEYRESLLGNDELNDKDTIINTQGQEPQRVRGINQNIRSQANQATRGSRRVVTPEGESSSFVQTVTSLRNRVNSYFRE